jgi:hypothetical protein
VDIEVRSLSDFHQHVMAEYTENFLPNWGKVKSELVQSSFGHDERFQEANYIAVRHEEMMQEAVRLFEKLDQGYRALATAAQYMAQEYEGADALSASNISQAQVTRAFTPDGEVPAEPAAPLPPAAGSSRNRGI